MFWAPPDARGCGTKGQLESRVAFPSPSSVATSVLLPKNQWGRGHIGNCTTSSSPRNCANTSRPPLIRILLFPGMEMRCCAGAESHPFEPTNWSMSFTKKCSPGPAVCDNIRAGLLSAACYSVAHRGFPRCIPPS